MRKWIIAVTVFALAAASGAVADDEANNASYLAGEHNPAIRGGCYVLAISDDAYEQTGLTRIYRFPEPPRAARVPLGNPLQSYDWYSHEVYVDCGFSRQGKSGVSVVRLGPWPRGYYASERQLAIAFYFNQRLLARYSTLDIAGSPDNVDQSVSHYTVFERVPGWVDGTGTFAVETVDGRALSFDLATGRLIEGEAEPNPLK